MRNVKGTAKPSSKLVCVIKGALIASIISIALVVAYALLIQYEIIGVDSISVVNTGIKLVGAAIASFIATRKVESGRWIVGGASGAVFIVLAFVTFSLLSGTYDISPALLADIGMGTLAGMVTAMIFQVIK